MKILLITILVFLPVVSFVGNVVKFVGCDFDGIGACEVVHGAGILVPPASVITVWIDTGDDNER